MAEAVGVSEDTAVDQAPVTGRELGRLLAHDCRTPLHAIQGFAELVLGGGAGPLSAEALDYVRQIAQAGRALEEALALAQELVDLDVCRPPSCELPMDLGTLLRALCFARIGDGADRPLPLIRGDRVAWLRIGQTCRAHLRGAAGDGARLTAQVRSADDGGLELLLAHADLSEGSYVGVLAIDLARRNAARQGVCLRLLGREKIMVTWPPHLVVGLR